MLYLVQNADANETGDWINPFENIGFFPENRSMDFTVCMDGTPGTAVGKVQLGRLADDGETVIAQADVTELTDLTPSSVPQIVTVTSGMRVRGVISGVTTGTSGLNLGLV